MKKNNNNDVKIFFKCHHLLILLDFKMLFLGYKQHKIRHNGFQIKFFLVTLVMIGK